MLLRRIAAEAGWDPGDHHLTLLAGVDVPCLPEAPAGLLGPDLLGAVHEALIDPATRRATGVHYTPAPLASALVRWALEGWTWSGPAPGAVDPAVGAGTFLLAVARWAYARGAPVHEVLAGLGGVDLDPVAVAVAEASLVAWARSAGWDGTGPGPSLVVGDGTEVDAVGATAELTMGAVDLVVGNPPFLGQLGRGTVRSRAAAGRLRARFGSDVGGYVDSAAVFLRVACEWPRPGGRVVMVQPESVLGARDAEGVRTAVAERADLVGLWVAGEPAFAAAVNVCAPVFEVRRQAPSGSASHVRPDPVGRAAGPGGSSPVARADGAVVRRGPSVARPRGSSWAPLLAGTRGVPLVVLDPSAGVLGDLATATSGFRQHFYALAPHLSEIPHPAEPGLPDPAEPGLPHPTEPGLPHPDLIPVLTTGLVDPVALLWGSRPARIAGSSWRRPGVSLGAISSEAPAVADWVGDRLRPKVVVASQTRVVEAAVDVDGRFVPGVPLVSVEPLGARSEGAEEVLWLIVAALSAPPVTAWAMAQAAGTARHRDALRLAARQIRTVPLPSDRSAWEAAAAELRTGRPLAEVGSVLTTAYGLDPDHPVTQWWRARLPRPRR